MYVSVGDTLEHLPLPGIPSSGECAVTADTYSVLTGRIEDALAQKGAAVYSDGIWSARLCAAWWLIMNQPPSEQAIRELLADNVPAQCSAILPPVCPKPAQSAIDAAKVAKPGWQADIGGNPLNPWLLAGVAALAVAVAFSMRKSRRET